MRRFQRETGKRERVLEAARQVFLEQGYGAASMDGIAAAAGVSKATLYAHFDGKEQLFAEMVSLYCREQEAAIAEIETAHPAIEEGLRRIALVVLDHAAHPNALRFGRMIMAEAVRFPALGRLFVESGILGLQARVALFLERARARGALTLEDPALAAELFVNMVRGPVQFRSLQAGGEPLAPEERARIAGAAARLMAAACAAG